jgi:hypothetical protein
MAAGDTVELATWLGGAVTVTGVLDANGLVAEVRRATARDVVFSGTFWVGGRPFPLAGAMPIPVPASQRFSPDAELDVSFTGRLGSA